MENNMEEDIMLLMMHKPRKILRKKVNGLMVKESIGLVKMVIPFQVKVAQELIENI